MPDPSVISLVPIAITLALSIYTRNVIIGLFSGVFTGVLMLYGVNPLIGLSTMITAHILPELTDSYNAGVLVLLALIGGFVALMEHSGGGAAFAKSVNAWVKSKVQAQIATWISGITIFFSDLGTPLIIGPIFRPLTDRLGVSRQKLAFIIDSTASPVAILIPFIGWGVYIMSLMNQEFTALNLEQNEFSAFIRTIPFQFYAWLAIALVPLLAFLKIDFGPMEKAEHVAQSRTLSASIENNSLTSANKTFAHPNAKPVLVWAPLCGMALVLCLLLLPLGFPVQQVSGETFRASLSTAYFSAATLLIALMGSLRVKPVLQSIDIYLKGMAGITTVAVTLILAWALSDLSRELGTSAYVSSVAQAAVPGWLLAAVVFLLAAIISFAIGSSWGTFAIMFPLVIPATVAVNAPLYVCMGAVLSGGLFGDHSSPISETTILSSTGANCAQIEHFRTQLPYALLNGLLSLIAFIVAGTTRLDLTLLGVLTFQAILLICIAKIK